jgi:SagB-type dehydrogenase family enzyme
MDDKFQKLFTGVEEAGQLWELYHDNSRLTNFDTPIPYSELQDRMLDLIISYEYKGYQKIPLEKPLEDLNLSLVDAIKRRRTALQLQPVDLTYAALSSILHYSYGVSITNEGTDFPHPFRMVPSAGALYPLEIFFHQNYVQSIDPGIYHYNPILNSITQIRRGDHSSHLRRTLVQPELSVNSSVIFFITAVMERSAFKYGERSYRFVHLEAGHLAQNMCLIAKAMDLGSVTVGGFIDTKLNEFIGIDGLNHAVIYVVAMGKDGDPNQS